MVFQLAINQAPEVADHWQVSLALPEGEVVRATTVCDLGSLADQRRRLLQPLHLAKPAEVADNIRCPGGAQKMGAALWKAWFQNEGGDNEVGKALVAAAQKSLVHGEVHLVSDCAEVMALPWELLRMETPADFVWGACEVALVRVLGAFSEKASRLPPLRAWFGLSCPAEEMPAGAPGFDTKWAWDEIERAKTNWGVYVETEVDARPGKQDFLKALDEHDIVYYMGHGTEPGSAATPQGFLGQAGLWLVRGKDQHAGDFLPASAIAQRASAGRCSLLVLNCCHSVEVAMAIYNHWAGAMPPPALPTIVATQWAWPVTEAFRLQENLFRAITTKRSGSLARALSTYRGRFAGGALGTPPCNWANPTLLTSGGKSRGGTTGTSGLQPMQMTVRVGGGRAALGLSERQVDELLAPGVDSAFPPAQVAQRARWRQLVQSLPYLPATGIPEFEMDIFPVTVQLYELASRGRNWGAAANLSWPAHPEHPALVSLQDAQAYCADEGVRLPTPQEWEYAARSGLPDMVPWGDAAVIKGICADNNKLWANVREAAQPGLVSVFECHPGPFGLRDMIGNAPEWVVDNQGRVLVTGLGYTDRLNYELPLLANLPSLFWQPLVEDLAGYRCAFRGVIQ